MLVVNVRPTLPTAAGPNGNNEVANEGDWRNRDDGTDNPRATNQAQGPPQAGAAQAGSFGQVGGRSEGREQQQPRTPSYPSPERPTHLWCGLNANVAQDIAQGQGGSTGTASPSVTGERAVAFLFLMKSGVMGLYFTNALFFIHPHHLHVEIRGDSRLH